MAEKRRKRILVVDDDPSVRLFVATSLRDEGYLVEAASDGSDAVDQLAAADPPDLVLLDIEMPRKDGYAVLEWLRGNPATAAVPVIFLTVRDTAEDQKRGLKQGVIDYLGKEVLTPDRMPILLYRIRNFFAWQENERLRGVLATIVSANHEINNPLMVIQGGADLIRIKGLLKPDTAGERALERIRNACGNIRDVLVRITGLTSWAAADYLEGVEMLDLDPVDHKTEG